MAQLSALARLVKRNAFEEFDTEGPGPRSPTKKGFTRGTMGATGSRGLQHRNPDAQEDEEREMMQSPVMEAFLKRHRRP